MEWCVCGSMGDIKKMIQNLGHYLLFSQTYQLHSIELINEGHISCHHLLQRLFEFLHLLQGFSFRFFVFIIVKVLSKEK